MATLPYFDDPLTPHYVEQNALPINAMPAYEVKEKVPTSDILNITNDRYYIDPEDDRVFRSKKLLAGGVPRLIECPILGHHCETAYKHTDPYKRTATPYCRHYTMAEYKRITENWVENVHDYNLSDFNLTIEPTAYNVSIPPLYHKDYPPANRQYFRWHDNLGNEVYNISKGSHEEWSQSLLEIGNAIE